MSGDVTLTADEVAALRDILAALSVIEDRGLRYDGVIEITRETWRDILVRPAQRLRRVTTPRLATGGGQEGAK